MSTKAHPDYGNTDKVKEWDMLLYVTDWMPKCVVAYKNLNRICTEHLGGKYRIEVIDLWEDPKIAREQQIVAIPTLVKISPKPHKIMIGDFTDEDKVLRGLGIGASG